MLKALYLNHQILTKSILTQLLTPILMEKSIFTSPLGENLTKTWSLLYFECDILGWPLTTSSKHNSKEMAYMHNPVFSTSYWNALWILLNKKMGWVFKRQKFYNLFISKTNMQDSHEQNKKYMFILKTLKKNFHTPQSTVLSGCIYDLWSVQVSITLAFSICRRFNGKLSNISFV